ncbi:MAG: response regulator [Ectothiorhodospiraceae bacterium]|nr:response regulator [Chromatiales bacterium]MCP5153692.1 response regulator [Ectothiorhodospiraceae bacterium]
MLVDDQPTFARNAARFLDAIGLPTEVASDLCGARRAMAERTFSALCLDVRLTDGDGLDLLEEVRMVDPRLPVLVMSAEDSAAHRQRAERLGAVGFLPKPFSLRTLADALRDMAGVEPSAPAPRGRGGRGGFTVVMYSHDGYGLGHLRRNVNIASRLVDGDPPVDVLLLVGSPSASVFALPKGVDTVKLPSVIKVGTDRWEPRNLRMTAGAAADIRARLVQRTVELVQPDLFLVDHVPHGVADELLPTLRLLRGMRHRPRTVLGLRDILDAPEVVRDGWRRAGVYDTLRDLYDAVLVYGRPEIFDTAAAYGLDLLPPERVHYCGYVCAPCGGRPARQVRTSLGIGDGPLVVVTAGGGHDAGPMMEATLGAVPAIVARTDATFVFVTGPLMPPFVRNALVRRAEGLPVRINTTEPDLPSLVGAADVVVTMAGYNTIVEALSQRTRVVVVPRSGPSAEQRMRATRLAASGHVHLVEPDDLAPEQVAERVIAALAGPPPAAGWEGLDGTENAAARLRELLHREAPAGPALLERQA